MLACIREMRCLRQPRRKTARVAYQRQAPKHGAHGVERRHPKLCVTEPIGVVVILSPRATA